MKTPCIPRLEAGRRGGDHPCIENVEMKFLAHNLSVMGFLLLNPQLATDYASNHCDYAGYD